MKISKIGLSIIASTACVCIAKPSDFHLVNQTGGIKTYTDGPKSVLIVEVPANKGMIQFSMGPEGKEKNKKNHRVFKKIPLKEHYESASQLDLYMAINGQFFSLQDGYYPVSYSLKSNGDIIKKGIEEEEKDKKLLFFMGTTPAIFFGYPNKNSYQNQTMIEGLVETKKIREAIVGVNPFDEDVQVKFGNNEVKGRTMIGCTPDKTNKQRGYSTCSKLYFVVAKARTVPSLISEMNSWGIPNDLIIQMDGSASSQAYTDKFNLNFNGSRIMPNAILIYKLWYKFTSLSWTFKSSAPFLKLTNQKWKN